MNKYLIASIVLVVATISFFISSRKNVEEQLKNGPIVIFGDSLVYGIGSTKGNSLPEQLQKRLQVPVINAGVPGDTTEDAKNRLFADVLSREPSIVILIIGGNDVLRGQPKVQTLQNVRDILLEIQKIGATPVLIGISSVAYNNDYKKIAQQMNVVFIPKLLEKTMGNRELMDDAVHPNNKGYAVFADEIEPVLRELMK